MCSFDDVEGCGMDSHFIFFRLAYPAESRCPPNPFLLNSSKGIWVNDCGVIIITKVMVIF